MSLKILSAAVVGLEAEIIEVEAEATSGELGSTVIVGLPDAAVSEAKERVRSAIKNSELEFPVRKVVVNLAPADIRKHGPAYDLPIAIGILSIKNDLVTDLSNSLFIGELSLRGELRPVTGVLAMALKAKEVGLKRFFVPQANSEEACLVDGLEVIPLQSLVELVAHLRQEKIIAPLAPMILDLQNPPSLFDLADVKGQEQAKRALEIAAAGGHNLLMFGPPGSGKTLLAKSLPSILPNLELAEALEITKIYSIAGELRSGALITGRPFRAPHHTSSAPALIGGGSWPRPGEISLAHRGVLFLDEFPEFPRTVLENLRQPLEDGEINICRAAGRLRLPAKIILVAAMNPCPCGYLNDPERKCVCGAQQVINYRRRLSGPIIDRIDLHVEVPRLPFVKLNTEIKSESSAIVKARIIKAREIQSQRFIKTTCLTNSEMSPALLKKYCVLDLVGEEIMAGALDRLKLSTRAYFRVLKIARTIADLAGVAKIQSEHLAEALQYRPRLE